MIKLSEEAKQAYAKFVGPDGKLIIDPALPDKVKEAFEFFNEEGINILELNIDDELDTEFEDDEPFDLDDPDNRNNESENELEDDEFVFEEVEDDGIDDTVDEDDIDDEDEDDEDLSLDNEVSESDQKNLNDLNNLF